MNEHFNKHLEELKKTVYHEPKFAYHEKMIDSAMGHFVKNGSFTNALDVGFGTGHSLLKFKELGIKATGITLDEGEYKDAHFLGYDVRLMDMNFLDFEDGSFDLVWCRHALEHSVMPLIALMEFKRVLGKVGFLYVEVPSHMIHLENANHYSMFTDEAWQALFRKAGFKLLFRCQQVVTIVANGNSQGYTDIYPQYWMRKE